MLSTLPGLGWGGGALGEGAVVAWGGGGLGGHILLGNISINNIKYTSVTGTIKVLTAAPVLEGLQKHHFPEKLDYSCINI